MSEITSKPRKYVLCIFNDEDMRVYFSGVSPRNGDGLCARIVKRMYSYDKDYLMTLAKMGRSDKWNEQDSMIDLSEEWESNHSKERSLTNVRR
jgi:hypothetical protein